MVASLRRPLAFVLLLAVSIQMAGCSLFGYSKQSVRVYSEPSNAKVTINGEPVGNTPLVTRVARRRDAVISISKSGYETQMRVADSGLSTLGVIDIVGGIFLLVPFFGLVAGGAYRLDPTTFTFNLEAREAALPGGGEREVAEANSND